VVGLGRGFVLTLPTLEQHPSVALVAAADPREEARNDFVSRFGAQAYPDILPMLADKAVEAIYVASPHEWHFHHVMAAIEAGKHVLVEKPMAADAQQCRLMAEAAAAAGTILVVGPSHGFDEPVLAANELVRSGRFGRVRMINAFNYTDFVYRPRRSEELNGPCGGVVFSQGTHQIDVVRRLAGGHPLRLIASTGDWDRDRPTIGAYMATIVFDNGVCASLTYSGYGHYDSNELQQWITELGRPSSQAPWGRAQRQLVGLSREAEENAKVSRTFGGREAGEPDPVRHHEHFGWVLVSCEAGDLRLTPSGIHCYAASGHEFLPIPPPSYSRKAVIDALVAAIRDGRDPVQDGIWGWQTMQCCEAIIRSADEKREINLQDSVGNSDDWS
jgi:phthalate 4,5-cis-dihydrodiol dehydrogenase